MRRTDMDLEELAEEQMEAMVTIITVVLLVEALKIVEEVRIIMIAARECLDREEKALLIMVEEVVVAVAIMVEAAVAVEKLRREVEKLFIMEVEVEEVLDMLEVLPMVKLLLEINHSQPQVVETKQDIVVMATQE